MTGPVVNSGERPLRCARAVVIDGMARNVTLSTLLAAALLLLVLPSASGAARVAVGGWMLDWPASTRARPLVAGHAVQVAVAPARGRSAPPRRARVTIALTRASDGRTLKRRTLRRGVFSATLPAATVAVRYRLTARVGRRLLRRATLRVAGVRPATPVAPCAPGGQAAGASSGSLVGDSSSLKLGGTLTLTFTNTSPTACLAGGLGYDVERVDDNGIWQRTGFNAPFPAIAVLLKPGQRQALTFVADERSFVAPSATALPLPPGRYRIVQRWSANQTDPATGQSTVVTGTWEFMLRGFGRDARCGPAERTPSARLSADVQGTSMLSLVNDGGVCLLLPDAIALERLGDDGSVAPAGTVALGTCAGPLATPGGGGRYGSAWGTTSPVVPPGRYRATAVVTAVPVGSPDVPLTRTVEFELTEPFGGVYVPIPPCPFAPWL